jgi:hypothetical protein
MTPGIAEIAASCPPCRPSEGSMEANQSRSPLVSDSATIPPLFNPK